MKQGTILFYIFIVILIIVVGVIYIYNDTTNKEGVILNHIQPKNTDANELETSDDFTGLKIIGIEDKSSAIEKSMIIKGVYRTFVRCGSQFSTWVNFPREVTFHLREINNLRKFSSIDMSISFSPHPSQVKHYSDLPCDQMVKEYFEVNIYNLIHDFPQESGVYEIYAQRINEDSNKIIFNLNK